MLSVQSDIDIVHPGSGPMRNLDCRLCNHPVKYFANDRRRSYYRCTHCELIFADPASCLDSAAEKAIYDLHQNSPTDPKYRGFLSQLTQPLLIHLTPGMHGLDYGCGPGPTLSKMCEEAGMRMDLYDPYYQSDSQVLNRTYDFVTCTEVVEHFYEPSKDWSRLASLLNKDSWLAVMTRLYDNPNQFHKWYYKNDPTHVSFYHSHTLSWIAERHGLTIHYQDHNVALFRKA